MSGVGKLDELGAPAEFVPPTGALRQIDHVIPVSVTDPIETIRNHYSLPPSFEIDDFENWVPACPRCNLMKGARVSANSPAIIIHLQKIQDQAPRARAIAGEYERDRGVTPLLVKLQTAFERGKISQSEIERIISKAPPPSEEVPLSEEWGVKQTEGKARVVHYELSPLYTVEGRKKFRAEQTSIRQEINQLSTFASRLDAEMAGLDRITTQGQEQFSQFSQWKADIEQRLVVLNASVRNIGWTGD